MRKKIAAGNWKMNKTLKEAEELYSAISEYVSKNPLKQHQEVIFFPPYPFIKKIENIKTGAQNCHWEEKGAFTGEVSAVMLKSCGADFVIIGHSERRQYFNETNQVLAKKVNAALKNDLIPVYCCGETLTERNEKRQFDVVKKQIHEGLFHLAEVDFRKIIIAYEPVWAIGTGVTATPQQAQEMHWFIRNLIKEKFSSDTSILYGGSCNASNAAALFSQPDIDGGLIGGASLKAGEFIAIIKALL